MTGSKLVSLRLNLIDKINKKYKDKILLAIGNAEDTEFIVDNTTMGTKIEVLLE